MPYEQKKGALPPCCAADCQGSEGLLWVRLWALTREGLHVVLPNPGSLRG